MECLHVDDDLLVLHKPPGLLCVPGRGDDKQDCLAVRAQQPWPGALVMPSLAPWRCSTCLTMARPRPVPPVSRERLRSTR